MIVRGKCRIKSKEVKIVEERGKKKHNKAKTR